MKSNAKKTYDVIIAGGGMAGMVMALCLAKIGLSPLIIEKAPAPDLTKKEYDGRNTALNSASIVMLQNLKIWDKLEPFAQPINDIIVSDGTVRGGASSFFLHFDHRHLGETPLGYFVENPDFRAVLQEEINASDQIDMLFEEHIEDISYEREKIALKTQKSIYDAKLLIAADGRNSFVRSMTDISVARKSYDQKGIVTTILHEKDHEGIAQEFFLPSGPFAMLPLKGYKTSLVWTERTEVADALIAQPEDVFLYEVRRRFGDSLGALTQTGPIISYPLTFSKVSRLYDRRIALIGDAAHGIHPIAGQGFNLGLRDIGVLTDLIEKYLQVGLDYGSDVLLKEYDRKRQCDIFLLGCVTDRLDWLFSNNNIALTYLRRCGLAIVNETPYLRNFFMKHATSQLGDLPKLMRAI
ncbi:MAG: UbiH/UbiF/VisC/COQ6 family ubiquinone biosynthesis hydroxylase [Pseudomonadota bacterium]